MPVTHKTKCPKKRTEKYKRDDVSVERCIDCGQASYKQPKKAESDEES